MYKVFYGLALSGILFSIQYAYHLSSIVGQIVQELSFFYIDLFHRLIFTKESMRTNSSQYFLNKLNSKQTF
jgi:hypothetical protein